MPGEVADVQKVSALNQVIFFSPSSSDDEDKLANAIFVYKVYLDGREELVRNAEFAGIGLYTFKDIVKVSKTHAVNTVPFRSEGNSSPFYGGRGSEVLVSIVTPRMVLFEDITLKPPSGESPKCPCPCIPTSTSEGRIAETILRLRAS